MYRRRGRIDRSLGMAWWERRGLCLLTIGRLLEAESCSTPCDPKMYMLPIATAWLVALLSVSPASSPPYIYPLSPYPLSHLGRATGIMQCFEFVKRKRLACVSRPRHHTGEKASVILSAQCFERYKAHGLCVHALGGQYPPPRRHDCGLSLVKSEGEKLYRSWKDRLQCWPAHTWALYSIHKLHRCTTWAKTGYGLCACDQGAFWVQAVCAQHRLSFYLVAIVTTRPRGSYLAVHPRQHCPKHRAPCAGCPPNLRSRISKRVG